MTKSVIEQIKELEDMSLGELKTKYKRLFGKTAPGYANGEFLKQRLAYRIQEIYVSSLSPRAITIIEKINKGKIPKINSCLKKLNLLPGSHITKQWKGTVYKVLVTDNGFTFNGQPYNSLSAIAKTITGTHWNGNRFFSIKGV